MGDLTSYIVIAAITGAGLITGLLFAFSNFVMRALAELPPDKGMFAMNQINEKIINPIFMLFFLGTPMLCAYITFKAIVGLSEPGYVFLLTGALAYLVGPFGITMLFNVPLNNQLAATDQSAASEAWPDYQQRWQRWNHIRTYIGVISIVFLCMGLAV